MSLKTVNQAAEMLALKPATIRKMILRRDINVIKLGRSVRLREEDLLALIQAGFRPAVNGAK